MKKILLIIILLLFPITVYAKTPNKEETFKVIKEIENVYVDEDIKIESTEITLDKIIFKINNEYKEIPYTFKDNIFSFKGGYYNKDIMENNYAFYLYSILENKSTIPYDENNYYNNSKIKDLIENNYKDNYIEPSNTFGISLDKKDDKIYITYNYYLDGEYPIMSIDEDSSFKNPATGNYSLLITIMLVCVLSIGAYTVIDPKKSK